MRMLLRWLHSRFCTESPDQSIHYEQLAIERTDQRESSSTTTYDHPVRSNGFLEPEQDYGAIKTPPLLPQDEEQDHASISGQGFFKEDHRMISERQNEEISVYSTARNAKVHKLNGSIRQAEEHNSQLQVHNAWTFLYFHSFLQFVFRLLKFTDQIQRLGQGQQET